MSDDLREANEAFYRAFETLKLERMAEIWDRSEEIECIHPSQRRLRGYKAVMDSWKRIFENTKLMQFIVTDAHETVQGDTGWVVCVENLITGESENPEYASVQATNIFRRIDGGWKMVLHHASHFIP